MIRCYYQLEGCASNKYNPKKEFYVGCFFLLPSFLQLQNYSFPSLLANISNIGTEKRAHTPRCLSGYVCLSVHSISELSAHYGKT